MEISRATNKASQASKGSANPSGERLNARTALLGLFVVLTMVFASTTVYESGTRTTLTSTSTSTSTATSVSTIIGTATTSTTVITTSIVLVSKAAFALSVRLDRATYTANQPITVNGSVSPVPNAHSNVTLIVTSPAGVAATATSWVSSINGSYSYTLVAGGSSAWVSGVYTVTAICVAFGATETASTQFAYTLPA